MKKQVYSAALGLMMVACGSQKSDKSENVPSLDEAQLASEFQTLPQGMVVRVPVDANGTMSTSGVEVRNYNGQEISESNLSELQASFAQLPINPAYMNGGDQNFSNINYLNLGGNVGQVPGKDGKVGQAPGQYPGQYATKDGKVGQAPGQYPGQYATKDGKGSQYPGQYPGKVGQAPGQYPGKVGQAPGQYPGKVGQAPGQYPGQYAGKVGQAPGQYPTQSAGKGKYSYAIGNDGSMFYPQINSGFDASYYQYNQQNIQNNYFYGNFRPVYRSNIYSNMYWSYYVQPYQYYNGSHCYYYYPRPSCGGYGYCNQGNYGNYGNYGNNGNYGNYGPY